MPAGSSLTLVALLVFGSAADAPARTAAPAAQPTPLQRVSELVKSAQARYETADYAEAIELWTQAYDLLPDTPEYTAQRNVLAYQIGQACVEAYALDPKLAYLRKADVLLSGYQQSIDPQDTETQTEIAGRLADIRAKIAEAERLAAEQTDREREEAERAREAAAAAKRPDPAIEAAKKLEEARLRRVAERDAKKWRRISIAGGVTLAAGASMLAVMGYGLARGAKIDDDGDAAVASGTPDPVALQNLLDKGLTANRLAVATGILGGALAVTGAALVGAGVVRERRARRAMAFAPIYLRGGAGLSFSARF